MSNDKTKRYGDNRHLWRKIVGYSTVKPVQQTVVDSITNLTVSYDLQTTFRHRDFFEVKRLRQGFFSDDSLPISFSYGEYDEGLVSFNPMTGEFELFNFNFTFSGPPYVTLDVDQVDSFSNINPYGITFSTTGAYIGISAPYSGTVRYRAIWAPSYPTLVTSAYTSSWITASAGAVLVNNMDEYSSFFGALATLPEEIHQTAWDDSTGTSDIYIETKNITTNYINSSLSALYSNLIHFIIMDLPSGSLMPTSSSYGFPYKFGFKFGSSGSTP